MIKIDWNPEDRKLSQFGLIALFGFPLIGLVFWWKFGAPIWVLWTLIGVGMLTLAASRIDPKLVKPVYVGLMLIAAPIGLVISYLLMGLIYYGLFTPVGLVFRLFGRDPLNKHPDPKVPSYWHDRGAPRPPASYLRLY
jgi:hypothetical protein